MPPNCPHKLFHADSLWPIFPREDGFGKLIESHNDSDLDEGDDAVFGTSARKKVGEKWPINKAAIIKSLTRQELSIKEGDIGPNHPAHKGNHSQHPPGRPRC